jgi:hypothetical protein
MFKIIRKFFFNNYIVYNSLVDGNTAKNFSVVLLWTELMLLLKYPFDVYYHVDLFPVDLQTYSQIPRGNKEDWRKSFLGIDSWAPTFKNTGSGFKFMKALISLYKRINRFFPPEIRDSQSITFHE